MRVWITKYALTTGIFESEGKIVENTPTMFEVARTEDTYSYYLHKPHWHESREEAVAQAEKMRAKKLVSLRKQFKKLESLSFGA